jgi:hypothetical protein
VPDEPDDQECHPNRFDPAESNEGRYLAPAIVDAPVAHQQR